MTSAPREGAPLLGEGEECRQLGPGSEPLKRAEAISSCSPGEGRLILKRGGAKECGASLLFFREGKKGDVTVVPEVQKLGFYFLTAPSSSHRTACSESNRAGPQGSSPGGEASGRGKMKTDLRWHLRHGAHMFALLARSSA